MTTTDLFAEPMEAPLEEDPARASLAVVRTQLAEPSEVVAAWERSPGQPVFWRRDDADEWASGVLVGVDPETGAEIRYVGVDGDGAPQRCTAHLGQRLKFVGERGGPDTTPMLPAARVESMVAEARAEATAHLDPDTGMPWDLCDRLGTMWRWGLDTTCGRWGYRSAGRGHARQLAELEADDDPRGGVAPLERVPWANQPHRHHGGRGQTFAVCGPHSEAEG